MAQEVESIIKEKAKRSGRADVTELVVGSRRVRERERLRCNPVFRRFLPDASPDGAETGGPAILVATSAGEVGVDLDADHMVCDLVPWERMVQRFGRVNRRPDARGHVALIDVFPASAEAEIEPEITDAHLATLLAPFHPDRFGAEKWPRGEDGRLDASPGMLHRLKDDPELKPLLEQASSEEPLRPALTKPLLEAWSMTSLVEHPGRPEVGPWLRGWVDDPAQTRVVWRNRLPVHADRRGESLSEREVRAFFEAAPPDISEVLETRTREEVVPWLVERAIAALKRAAPAAEAKGQDDDPAGGEASGSDAVPAEDAPAATVEVRLGANAIVAFLLNSAGTYERSYTLETLTERSRRRELERELSGRTLIIDARLGGLDPAGLLSGRVATPPPTLDGAADPEKGWSEEELKAIGFRVCRAAPGDAPPDKWRIAWRMPDDPDKDDQDNELRVEVWRGGDATRGDPAIAPRPQVLAEHHEWAAREAAKIADGVGLCEPYRAMLIAAAAAHDAGKARELWQRAMGAPPDKGRPYAKTAGRGIPGLLEINGQTYRHEFGSLREVKKGDFLPDVPDNVRDLALHLIASHHGFARPVIAALDPEAPPSACAELAREAALRFARLQAEWGVWGLAWWEALLRAADWAASRKLNEDGGKA